MNRTRKSLAIKQRITLRFMVAMRFKMNWELSMNPRWSSSFSLLGDTLKRELQLAAVVRRFVASMRVQLWKWRPPMNRLKGCETKKSPKIE